LNDVHVGTSSLAGSMISHVTDGCQTILVRNAHAQSMAG
jgi:hypothetical protein